MGLRWYIDGTSMGRSWIPVRPPLDFHGTFWGSTRDFHGITASPWEHANSMGVHGTFVGFECDVHAVHVKAPRTCDITRSKVFLVIVYLCPQVMFSVFSPSDMLFFHSILTNSWSLFCDSYFSCVEEFIYNNSMFLAFRTNHQVCTAQQQWNMFYWFPVFRRVNKMLAMSLRECYEHHDFRREKA